MCKSLCQRTRNCLRKEEREERGRRGTFPIAWEGERVLHPVVVDAAVGYGVQSDIEVRNVTPLNEWMDEDAMSKEEEEEVVVEVKQDRRLVNNNTKQEKVSLSLSLSLLFLSEVCGVVYERESSSRRRRRRRKTLKKKKERKRDWGFFVVLLRGCHRRPSVARPMK